MAGSPKFFGRKYKLTLDIPGVKKLVFEVEDGKPAMDIKFDVTYARGQVAREGTVSVLGLSLDTMHSFLDLAGMTRGKAMSELVRVKLEAGYFSSAGMVEILNGFAWYATVTSPPTMWLNIKVSEYNPMGGRKVAVSYTEPMRLEDAVNHIMSQFEEVEGGITFSVEDRTEDELLSKDDKVKLSFPTSEITLSEAIQELNRQCSDEIQFILKTSENDDDCRTLLAVDKNIRKSTPGDVEVDGENGLLSVTGIDAVNGCITTFIDGTVEDEMSHLVLTSALNPQANGRYYIVKKQFIGHYMGQEWYARYFCSAREGDPE